MQPHAGPHAGAPRAGLEAEAGVRGDPRPEPLLGSVCEFDEPLLGCLGVSGVDVRGAPPGTCLLSLGINQPWEGRPSPSEGFLRCQNVVSCRTYRA